MTNTAITYALGLAAFMAWPLIIACGAYAAGVFLQGVRDMAHWHRDLQADAKRLRALRRERNTGQ